MVFEVRERSADPDPGRRWRAFEMLGETVIRPTVSDAEADRFGGPVGEGVERSLK
jgi:hypothetical protein